MLANTGSAKLPPGFRVAIEPVRAAARWPGSGVGSPYVMGDDPERMDADAVVAARAVRRALIRSDEPVAGYLYLVCHKAVLPARAGRRCAAASRRRRWRSIAGIVALTTLLAALVIAAVTRPLQR